MNLADSIRQSRKSEFDEFFTADKSESVTNFLKNMLTTLDRAVIRGAKHFQVQEYRCTNTYCQIPYKYYNDLKLVLINWGFHVSDYYNKGGIHQGIEVTL